LIITITQVITFAFCFQFLAYISCRSGIFHRRKDLRWHLESKMVAEIQRSITLEQTDIFAFRLWQWVFISISSMTWGQILSTHTHMVDRSRMAGSKAEFYHNFEFLILFQSIFYILLWKKMSTKYGFTYKNKCKRKIEKKTWKFSELC
jgi:hypothetical protein